MYSCKNQKNNNLGDLVIKIILALGGNALHINYCK